MFRSIKLHHIIILALSIIVTLAAVFAGVALAPQSMRVNLTVDGAVQTVTLNTNKATVKQALAEADVSVRDAVIAPDAETTITDGSAVTVRYEKPLQVVVDGEIVAHDSTAVNVEEALVQVGATPTASTYVSEDLDQHIPVTGLDQPLIVSKTKSLVLVAKGKARNVLSNAPTVGDLLQEQNVKVDANDDVSTALHSYTKPNLKVKVVKVKVVKKKLKKQQALGTVTRKDKTMDIGESLVLKAGSPRVVSTRVQLVYRDGKLSRRNVLDRNVVSRGAKRIVVKGTKPLPPPEPTYAETAPGGSCGGWGPLLAKYFGSQASTACRVMMCESGGNPRAQNPVSSASGLFQFIDGTWASARAAVPGGSSYSRALYAPAELQIQAAAAWLARTSWSQWSCY